MWAAILSVILGVWLMIAPSVLHMEEAAALNNFVTGPLVATAAIIAIWEINRQARYFNLVAGLWLILSPIALPYEFSLATLTTMATGIGLSLLALVKGDVTGGYGGGWSSLFVNREQFKDKVVVVTGASGGVGRVTAWEFAKQGARVVLIARDKAQLDATAREVKAYGGRALALVADVADPEQVEHCAILAEREFGPIDVWVNNAMNSVFAPFKKIDALEFKRVTEVTYLGTVYGTMAALKRMLPRNRGSIVLVGSALAYRGIPLQSAYCGAKHGIQGFYDSLRTELIRDKSNIKTCMVQLPAMNTTQFGWVLSKLPNEPRPVGKIYQPDVAARAIVFAASRNRREIWVGWPTYLAILGNKIAPWYADWVLSRQGYEAQQTDKPVDPDRKDNVFEPVGEDRGAYGDFGALAVNRSITLWMSMYRLWVRLFAMAVLTGLILMMLLQE